MDDNDRIVAGVFDTRELADRAIDELRLAGFRDDHIGVMNRTARSAGVTQDGEGAEVGALSGAALGALGGMALASIAIPVVGPVAVGGALAAVLISGTAGAATGGLLGALVGMGMPEDEARYFEGELAPGRSLVTVRAGDRYEQAVAILWRCGARRPARSRAEAPVAAL